MALKNGAALVSVPHLELFKIGLTRIFHYLQFLNLWSEFALTWHWPEFALTWHWLYIWNIQEDGIEKWSCSGLCPTFGTFHNWTNQNLLLLIISWTTRRCREEELIQSPVCQLLTFLLVRPLALSDAGSWARHWCWTCYHCPPHHSPPSLTNTKVPLGHL